MLSYFNTHNNKSATAGMIYYFPFQYSLFKDRIFFTFTNYLLCLLNLHHVKLMCLMLFVETQYFNSPFPWFQSTLPQKCDLTRYRRFISFLKFVNIYTFRTNVMFVIGKLINDTYIMNNLMVLFKVNLKPYSYVGWAYIIHSCHVCKIQIHLPPSITPFNKSM